MKHFLLQFAQKIDAGSVGIPNATNNGGELLLHNGLNLTYFLAGVVSIIVIIVAGIMYTTASGDASRITRAKNLLTYSIVGLVVVLSAFVITNFVIGSFN